MLYNNLLTQQFVIFFGQYLKKRICKGDESLHFKSVLCNVHCTIKSHPKSKLQTLMLKLYKI